ncbi:MAG: TatD family hydrolase [Alphaproteobacteria bacterium]|nr:TatD family hydrolase [Alphaproteobacteria bacterium]
MLIDSHCHLDFPALVADRDGVLQRARAAGITRMVNISTRRADMDAVRVTAEQVPDVFCTVGVHPHHVHEEGEHLSTEELASRAAHPKVVGIGETGLDFYYDTAPRDRQEDSFRRHIRAAQAAKLPLIIHSRDAEEDTIRVLKSEGPSTGVMHCFSSRRILAEQALEIGFYISLSGILTFKKSQELRDIARDMPLDRLLVETDSPYLAPEPYRGKTCEPAYVVCTAQVLAEIKGISPDDIARHTTENFFRLFTKVSRP